MIERTQPVVVGKDKKGELVWGVIPMPRWQMELFRVRYYGDFWAHWMLRMVREVAGFEPDHDVVSMDLTPRKGYTRKSCYRHPGD